MPINYIDNTFWKWISSEKLVWLATVFPGIKKMRKPECSFYKPDGRIELLWEEYIIEIKSSYTKWISYWDKDKETAYHLKRNMFLSKNPDVNFLEITKVWEDFIFQVYWH